MAATLALGALAWIVGDAARLDRFLALTGIAPADLRDRAGEPAFLVEVLRHLEGYEADLTACAGSLGIAPTELVDARHALERA